MVFCNSSSNIKSYLKGNSRKVFSWQKVQIWPSATSETSLWPGLALSCCCLQGWMCTSRSPWEIFTEEREMLPAAVCCVSKGNQRFKVMLNLFPVAHVSHLCYCSSIAILVPLGTPRPSGPSCPRTVLQQAGPGDCFESKNRSQDYHSPLIPKDRGCVLRAKPLGAQQRLF